MNTIPTLTEQTIRNFVGEQNFLKGQQGVRDGAIINPEQQAMMLKAYCSGSLPEPYRVQVTFDGSRITSYLCSCPAGTSVYANRGCEHAATLLLAWKEQPEAFTQTDDIDIILERQSKAQLITLIKQLLQKQPEVEWQLTMPPLPGHKSVPIDVQEYRDPVISGMPSMVSRLISTTLPLLPPASLVRGTIPTPWQSTRWWQGVRSAITSPITMRTGH